MSKTKGQSIQARSKRGTYHEIKEILKKSPFNLPEGEKKLWEELDMVYRTISGILYTSASSGHPGGALSPAKVVSALLFNTMDYDFHDPIRKDADVISYAAGHKAMGLYAMWALRNEVARIAKPELVPNNVAWQIRLEDLLGFRKNPTCKNPLFNKFKSKALDGHPAPSTPHIKLSTGASGVGFCSSFGLALGALDAYRQDAPKVHILESETGITAGRTFEAMAAAATNQLRNIVVHLDWNQASIDSDHVCYEAGKPGDYVQWDPIELFQMMDWNVIFVEDGFDLHQILAAQKLALTNENNQPTAIIYRTIKGQGYGVTGKASHGSGWKFNSSEYHQFLKQFEDTFQVSFPRHQGEETSNEAIEKQTWEELSTIRRALEKRHDLCQFFGDRLFSAKERLDQQARRTRSNVPNLSILISDICLCQYTDHGHCGVIKDGQIDNDASLNILSKIAISQAKAGAHIVAPSDMMDGRVGAIRQALDRENFPNIAILSYAAKYASSFYGPFREAAQGAPQFGDRRSYQMDSGNALEALREVALDLEEGADMVMVKPASLYLDIIRRIRENYTVPIAAYHVSGEYAMVHAAAEKGWLNAEACMMETLLAIKRAGADLILTYYAKEALKHLA